ncbi:SDR family NAD(P)-dependent oxidoreductase [Allosphingosinicella deserti]|uniref:Short-chain dehydrogenase n=1 Tax=Allosphingosinicella deserti TaxID=2116704 RepID=A0A2P7QNB6_9SPHN|nr:SDR family NAD(P)-dependent oxidoreductase [Sphingomonas deserti]PSJ39469.1 short-chain dehydrogenase [Sphingomonas deserti]
MRLVNTVMVVLALLTVGGALSGCAAPTHLRASDGARIQGRTYVVVGASSGFGRGVAERLGANGANVVLAARRAELLEEVAGQVRSAGGTALVVPTDVGRPEDVARLAEAALARFGRIDVWMNIAGVGAIGRFEEIPIEDHSRIVQTNLNGVIYGSHAALRQFKAQGYGILVNMGSVESQVPLAYHSSYAATKAGVWALGRTLNEELRLAGVGKTIKVVTVMPWAADTPFWSHAANYSGHKPRMILMDDPDKVAEAIVWVSLHPREELPVGWKAQTASTFHTILPDLTERISADIVHREMAKGSPDPATTGAVHRPMEEGRGVEGGVRKRMDREDKARKQSGPR